MICILGCLNTENGNKIKDEMCSWLNQEHNVFISYHDGSKYEYPSILKVIHCSIELNEPVLYVHTKGAYNSVPLNYKTSMMAPDVNYPKEAKPEDCQKIVRNMWKHEFSGDRLKLYLDVVNTDKPVVACPLTGKEKITWQNGWIINPSAAKELLKTYHFDNSRYYYEQMFRNTNINVIGLISNNININNNKHSDMWNIIWKFYDK